DDDPIAKDASANENRKRGNSRRSAAGDVTKNMSEPNKALVRRWFDEVWNQGRERTIDELFASHGVGYGLGEPDVPIKGPAEFKPFVRNLRGAIPDIHIRIEDMLAEGDKVAARIVVEGTHKGDTLGVPASGQPVRFQGIVEVRIANGQIVEGWNSWD